MSGSPIDQDEQLTTTWHDMLTGEDASLARLRRVWRHVPSSPRCKVCAAPFSGPGSLVSRFIMGGRATTNPLVCNACFGDLRRHRGGAEVPLSVLFADVRGSTALAERIGAAAYTKLLHRFYSAAAEAIERSDGILDKFLGDGVMALFIPVIAGERHAAQALKAGRDLLRSVERRKLGADGLEVGAGVHTGSAYAGAIGSDDRLDFTALGDTVNVAARLGARAAPGQLLVSLDAWSAAGEPGEPPGVSHLEIAGRTRRLEVAALQITRSESGKGAHADVGDGAE